MVQSESVRGEGSGEHNDEEEVPIVLFDDEDAREAVESYYNGLCQRL